MALARLLCLSPSTHCWTRFHLWMAAAIFTDALRCVLELPAYDWQHGLYTLIEV